MSGDFPLSMRDFPLLRSTTRGGLALISLIFHLLLIAVAHHPTEDVHAPRQEVISPLLGNSCHDSADRSAADRTVAFEDRVTPFQVCDHRLLFRTSGQWSDYAGVYAIPFVQGGRQSVYRYEWPAPSRVSMQISAKRKPAISDGLEHGSQPEVGLPVDGLGGHCSLLEVGKRFSEWHLEQSVLAGTHSTAPAADESIKTAGEPKSGTAVSSAAKELRARISGHNSLLVCETECRGVELQTQAMSNSLSSCPVYWRGPHGVRRMLEGRHGNVPAAVSSPLSVNGVLLSWDGELALAHPIPLHSIEEYGLIDSEPPDPLLYWNVLRSFDQEGYRAEKVLLMARDTCSEEWKPHPSSFIRWRFYAPSWKQVTREKFWRSFWENK